MFCPSCRFGLADLSVAAARKVSVPLQSLARHGRRRTADPVAPRVRRERSTMERAGRRNSGVDPNRSGVLM